MPDWTPSWGTTALISIATSLLTLIVAGRYIQPLLEVRNRRFQAKMQAREKFQATMLTVLTATTQLLESSVATMPTGTTRNALREEHARWRAQLDEATTYLIDHSVQLLYAYVGPPSRLAVRYSNNTRGVWISDRDDQRKLRALRDITEQCHTLFFDSTLHGLRRARAMTELERLLDELETPPAPTPEPAPTQ